MSTELHVKCRDAYQQLADAHNEEIEKRTPLEVKYGTKHFDSLKWETKAGTKGEYQQTTKQANENSDIFQALQKILKDHSGFWQDSTYKYWTHQNNFEIIDRRRKNQSNSSGNPHDKMTRNLANIKKAGSELTQE